MAKSLGELQGNIYREPIEMPDGKDYRLKHKGDWWPDDWREYDEDMELLGTRLSRAEIDEVTRRMMRRFFHDNLPDGVLSKVSDNDFAGVHQYFFVRRTPTEMQELRAKAEAAEKLTGDSSEAA